MLAIIAIVFALAHLCAAAYRLQGRRAGHDVPRNVILLQRQKKS